MYVLLVEDDPQVMATVSDYLEFNGHEVNCAYNGKAALNFAEQERYDVIILDVMMPKLNGLEAAKAIRQRLHQDTPIIFLTARDTLDDKLKGFQAGGDDYLIKPFDLQELEARLHALVQRGKASTSASQLRFGSLHYDVSRQQGEGSNGRFSLSNVQHRLLHKLLGAVPEPVDKAELVAYLWQDDVPDSDAFRSHLYNLRQKLKRHAPDVEIITEAGRGCRLAQRSSQSD